jgi:hypothetical protein
MHTKIKILLLTFVWVASLPLHAQWPFRQVQIDRSQRESLVAFTTTYSCNIATRQIDIRVEKQTYLPAYARENNPNEWDSAPRYTSPQPLNLEDVACLISDAKLSTQHALKGEVELQVLIDARGRYLSHRIISMEYSPVVAAAEKQIDQVRFRPASQGGQVVACWVDLRFVFL